MKYFVDQGWFEPSRSESRGESAEKLSSCNSFTFLDGWFVCVHCICLCVKSKLNILIFPHSIEIFLRSASCRHDVSQFNTDVSFDISFASLSQTQASSTPLHKPGLNALYLIFTQVHCVIFIDQLYHVTHLVLTQTLKHPLCTTDIDLTMVHFCICSTQGVVLHVCVICAFLYSVNPDK